MPKRYDNYIEYLNRTIQITKKKKYAAIDLFAGCGGLSLGFEAAGISTVGYEMIEDCCKTYRKNLKTKCYQNYITTETEFPKAQIVIGGPPCQPFSRRGKQTGKADMRNGFPAFINAVKKIKPDIWMCENVKGLPEQNKEYFELIIKEFENLGYIVEHKVFKMAEFDVPQNRERLVIVGHQGGYKFPVENDYKISAGEALGELAYQIPDNAQFLTPAMDSYIAKYEAASQCKNPRDLYLDRPARTLTCRNLAGATSDMHRIKLADGRRRRITVQEAARLQGFPDWYRFYGTEESQFTQIGNAVPPICSYKLALSVVEYMERRMKMSYENLPEINYKKTFNQKSEETKKLIRQALQILQCLGIPFEDVSERQKEKTAMAFLAVADVKKSNGWKKMKDSNNDYAPTTREIIDFYNDNFEEKISKGSYDDIRRKDIRPMVLADIIIQSKPAANMSNPTRGYKINVEYSRIIKKYGQSDWFTQVETFNKMHPTFEERILSKREITKISVKTVDGKEVFLNDGEHNVIQKQIVEEFLPRFGYNSQLLYLGDSDNKYGLIYEEKKLKELGFSDLKGGILPDIVAYSQEKEWIYLIEAYHTSNPITPFRKLELEKLAGAAASKVVFVTAFENMFSYKNCTEELAWETEIWIATDPDHMIHRDGSRFLGPYNLRKYE